jgi:hypothetical protein
MEIDIVNVSHVTIFFTLDKILNTFYARNCTKFVVTCVRLCALFLGILLIPILPNNNPMIEVA